MKSKAWGYISGSAIFVAIVCIWIWQLPNIITHTAHGKDDGLSGIMTLFGGAKTSMSSDLNKVQAQLDSNLKKVNQAIATQEVQAAAITDLKKKIDERAVKDINLPNAR